MISKKELQEQCENIIGEGKGYLNGESIKEVLNDLNSYNGIDIYWSCIDEKILDEKF